MQCSSCGASVGEDSRFCPKCGSVVIPGTPGFIITTIPGVPGYRVKKVLGVVSGVTPRTRGILGKFIAGFESMIGGEVTAFTSEIEKARAEAMDRARYKAHQLGANAIIGLDVETSDLGYQLGVLVFSATGTAVVVEPES